MVASGLEMADLLVGFGVYLRLASLELLLFASVFILIFGAGDVLVDALWLGQPRARKTVDPLEDESRPHHRLAIFIPAWREAAVIGRTLDHLASSWHGERYRLYVGCYRNDAATLLKVATEAVINPQLRVVVHDADGPTTKADCLNALWTAMRADERDQADRFDAVILHDAEDYVDPGELAVFDHALSDYAFVQIPVVPLLPTRGHWIAGHYADEFAEAHQKELAVRRLIGAPLPAAGVGCAFRRDALDAMSERGNPFRAESLVEDYECGLAVSAAGLPTAFLRQRDGDGALIAVRSYFPDRIDDAVRQKARWITGIALTGWDRIGWLTGRSLRALAGNWMLWRDRRAMLAAVVTLAGYLGAVGLVASEAIGQASGTDLAHVPDQLRILLGGGFAVLTWRLVMRYVCTTRLYGHRQGLRAVPRVLVSNIVAILAARRALTRYLASLAGADLVWDKTEHARPHGSAASRRAVS
ncbi:MAG: glycosyl transferase family protein [Sphingomonadales bacterium]|nr:glycosyl transferase family protein [Sphingomonadales bacterium]